MSTRSWMTRKERRATAEVPSADESGVLLDGDSTPGDPDEIPETPPVSLGKRFLQPKTFVSFGLAAFIVYFVVRGLGIDMDAVWEQIRGANLPLLAAAFVSYYSAILIRSIRWRMMLKQVGIDRAHGYRLPGVPGTFEIVTLSLFANCVVPARLGDAYRSFLLKDRSGASFGLGFGTILAERLIDVIVMVGVVVTAGAVVFGTNVPGRAEQAFLLGLGVVILGVLGSIGLHVFRDRIEARIPERFAGHYRRLNKGIFDILRRPLPFAALGVLIWLMDGLRVWLVAESLGASLTIPEAIVVSMLSALVTIVPFTPAGLGLVEGFMVWLLPQVGVPQDTAVAIALIDRSITYLSLILVGLPLYIFNVRRDVKHVRNDLEPATGSN
ncbi:MAG: flippase-like domain-containing protein [Chloroflexia bacterium]|nr:flippase-like domain-containing protein [Chloroflexia bacterium]